MSDRKEVNNNSKPPTNNQASNNNDIPSSFRRRLSTLPRRRRNSTPPGFSLTTIDGTTIHHPTTSTSRSNTVINAANMTGEDIELGLVNDFPSSPNTLRPDNNNASSSSSTTLRNPFEDSINWESRGSSISSTLHYDENDYRCTHPHDEDDDNSSHLQVKSLNNNTSASTSNQDDDRRHSEATLVDEALGRKEAKGRHIQFADCITESMSLINGILSGKRRSSVWPRDSIQSFEQEREHRRRDSVIGHGQQNAGGGSVLGSLLRLESQLQATHRAQSENHHNPKKRHRRRQSSEQTVAPPRPPSPGLIKRESTTAPPSIRSLPSLYSHHNASAPVLQSSSSSHFGVIRKRPREWLSNVTSSSHLVPSLQDRKREISSRKHDQDSVCSTSSQFDRISVNDRVRIAFEIANILQRQQFLCKLARCLMLYGCPAHRLEYILKHVSDTLNVDAEFIYLPSIMLMTFFDPDTHTTETHFIRQSMVFDMHKLGEIYRLEKLVGHGEVTVDEALDFIDKVEAEPKFYPSWLNPFIYAVISLCGALMFFGGRWKEAGLSAGLAMFFAVYELFSGRFWGFRPIWEITVCIVIGFVARASTKFDFCFIPTAFSSIIVILPGYSIAIAIIELVSRQLVSGIVHTGYAIIFSFLLGYGISMGSALYRAMDPNTPTETGPYCEKAANANTCIVAVSQYYFFLTVPLFAIAYCLLVQARTPRWPTITFVSICGFVVNWLLSCIARAPSQVIQVTPAFAVGLIGNILTKLSGIMSFDAVLVAIFYLVPGSLGLKAAIGLFFGQEAGAYESQGAFFALSMIEVCIGIALGLCIANLIIYPKGAQRTPIMNI